MRVACSLQKPISSKEKMILHGICRLYSRFSPRLLCKRSRTKLLDSNYWTPLKYRSFLPSADDSTLAWIRSSQPSTKRENLHSENFYRVKHLLESGFTEEAYDLYVEESKNNYNHLDFLYEYGRLFLDAGEVTKVTSLLGNSKFD